MVDCQKVPGFRPVSCANRRRSPPPACVPAHAAHADGSRYPLCTSAPIHPRTAAKPRRAPPAVPAGPLPKAGQAARGARFAANGRTAPRIAPKHPGRLEPVAGAAVSPRLKGGIAASLRHTLDLGQQFPKINGVRLVRTFEKAIVRVEAVGVPRQWPLRALCCSGLRMAALSMEPVACRPPAPSLFLAVRNRLFVGDLRCC